MIPHLLDEGGCSGVIPQNWHLTWTFRVLLDSSSLLIFYLYKYSLPQAPRRGPHELFSQPFFFWRHPHELLRMTQVENTALPVSWQMFLTWLRPFFHKQIETHQRIKDLSQIEIKYNYSLLAVCFEVRQLRNWRQTDDGAASATKQEKEFTTSSLFLFVGIGYLFYEYWFSSGYQLSGEIEDGAWGVLRSRLGAASIKTNRS